MIKGKSTIKITAVITALGLPIINAHTAFAATAGVSNVENFIRSIITVFAGLAGLVATSFLVAGGFIYITSSGNPEHLDRGKRTITYTCPNCSHTYKDRLDFNAKEEEKLDPDYESDRHHYCLEDEKHRKQLMDMARDLKAMAELGKQFKEKEDNKHIYDAIKEIKKPKIAELIPLLSEPLEKAGYIEFHLDKPEMGREVYVGFSCLDSKSDRNDHDSRKALKKLVGTTLKETNWRLMSDGISYRLGYLNGRIRAYENEEDLKKLVTKDKDLIDKARVRVAKDTRTPAKNRTLKTPDGKEVIL